MNEKTDAASWKGLEEAASTVGLPEPIEEPAAPAKAKRRRKRPALHLGDLRNADLKDQDLTKVKGLLPEHLAGADLTGAKLPDEIGKFPALDQVAAVSGEARKIFIGLLAACVYCWLVIGTTTDAQLIVNTASSPLPIINTPIPIAGFYVIGAALLAAVYFYLHFYLHYLWRMLSTLPAVFPDGMALDEKSDPWLLTNFVRLYFERLKPLSNPLKRLETALSIGLAWGLVPLTLFALWVRYLPSHDWRGTYWLVVLTFITVSSGWRFFRFARATLRGEPPSPYRPGPRETWRELLALGRVGRMFALIETLTPAFLIICSVSAFLVDPRESGTWVAKSLNTLRFVGIRTYADLREAEVAQRPEGWTGKEWDKVKRVDLRERNLFADATGAFLANADLRGANLKGAVLEDAQLQGARLEDAEVQNAVLIRADHRGADLRHAPLQGAHF